jgi:hypothetical protein
MTDAPKKIEYIGEKPDDFKVIFADGCFTWLQRETGTITFFYDVFSDEMVNSNGAFDVSKIKRVFPVEIRMRRSAYTNLLKFMIEQLKMIEDAEKLALDENGKK